jgi:large subunit ribosomal protein L17
MLTEQEMDPGEVGAAKVKGRIITTLPKAKEVRPLVEKCITIARRGIAAAGDASVHGTTAERGTAAWKEWRTSPKWQAWAQAMAPAVKARRRVVTLLGDKKAARVVFEVIAPRYVDRPGGYTRIFKLAKPRLGDAGDRAILEFVREEMVARPQSPKLEKASG